MLDLSLFPSPVVIGHRGASGYRPEHSRAAYDLAFEQGADFVEPDIVVTRDGVLVIRHENEISGTTDVAGHPQFADRRTTKVVDGESQTGWFTEDFTWAELQVLRCRERLPEIRPFSATFDGEFAILRLSDLFALVDAATDALRRPLGVVAELKHAAYFARLGFAIDELFLTEVVASGWDQRPGRLVVESFEPTVLELLVPRVGSGRPEVGLGWPGVEPGQQEVGLGRPGVEPGQQEVGPGRPGVAAGLVQLVDGSGSPADLVARFGSSALSYSSYLTDEGLSGLAAAGIDGVSVPKAMLLGEDVVPGGAVLVERAHAAGLSVFTWTLRPENEFVDPLYRTDEGPAELGDWQSEWGRIIGAGVDGVFADHPDAAVTVRNELGERPGNPPSVGGFA